MSVALEQSITDGAFIPFTQYLLPNGRRKEVTIEVDQDVAEKARELIAEGLAFECEVLTTGHVSLTITDQTNVALGAVRHPVSPSESACELALALTRDAMVVANDDGRVELRETNGDRRVTILDKADKSDPHNQFIIPVWSAYARAKTLAKKRYVVTRCKTTFV